MVSVIIPIYNPGDKLRICLESLQAQSYGDLEVIMVNDGSQDGSAVICQHFVRLDSRFVYIEQENAGVSAARNKGILRATGEYICFVDSDDSVAPDYVECMVYAMQHSGAELVVQGLTNICKGHVVDKKNFPNLTVKVNDLSDALFEELFYFCGPYCKLFRSEIVRRQSLRFPHDLAYGEDFVFYAGYLHFCKTISFVANTSYHYSVAVSGSLSSVRLRPEKFWKNQLNRRFEYQALRKQYGITRDFYPTENRNKLIALRGLISSVNYYNANLKDYIDRICGDKRFGFADIRPQTWSDKLILSLVKANNYVSRFLLQLIFRL